MAGGASVAMSGVVKNGSCVKACASPPGVAVTKVGVISNVGAIVLVGLACGTAVKVGAIVGVARASSV